MGLARLLGLSKDAPKAPPGLPEDTVIYAIGDIHGRADLLDCLFDRIGRHADQLGKPRRHLVFLGDYVDRGMDSRGVLDRLAGFNLPGFVPTFLKGNHEVAMLDFLTDPAGGRAWLTFGGDATLLSYGVARPTGGADAWSRMRDGLDAALPDHHRRFLSGLETFRIIGGYAFVHAGIRPGIPLERQKEADLLWIRDEFLESTRDHGSIVVHGHTVTAEPEVRPNRIGIDTGAYMSNILTCAVLRDDVCRFIQT